MSAADVRVPAALLLDSNLSAQAKVVWMAARAGALADGAAGGRSHSIARLAAHTGFMRPTVRKALVDLSAAGWAIADLGGGASVGRRVPGAVRIPSELLSAKDLSPFGRVLYGVLQRSAEFDWPSGSCTYAELGDLTGLQPRRR